MRIDNKVLDKKDPRLFLTSELATTPLEVWPVVQRANIEELFEFLFG
jgi:hypothetical protein